MIRIALEVGLALLVSGLASAVLNYWTSNRRIALFGGVSGAVIVVAILMWVANMPPPTIATIITEPSNGMEVGPRTTVTGKSTPIPKVVYVLVQPRSTNSWWVQDLPLVQNDGSWSVNVHIGTESAGAGQSFDIVALATNEGWLMRTLRDANLTTAQQFSTTIPFLAKSNLVTVKRPL